MMEIHAKVEACMQELQTERGIPHLEELRRQVRESEKFKKAIADTPDIEVDTILREALRITLRKDPGLAKDTYHAIADEAGFTLSNMGYDRARDDTFPPGWVSSRGRKRDREIG